MQNELIKTDGPKVTDAELTMHLENLGLLKDLTSGEKNSYLQIAKAFNLNPFKREIHVSKYNGQMSIITGYEVYIKRAERSGQLDGWSVVTTGDAKDGTLKATVTIHRKDRSHPFVWEAMYSEYVQKTKEGAVNKFWQKSTTMIKKVAISQAFRLCFSDELGGMPYTSDEMDTQDVQADVTNAAAGSGFKPDIVAKKKVTDKMFGALMMKLGAEGADVDQIVKDTMDKLELTDQQSETFVTKVAELQGDKLPV